MNLPQRIFSWKSTPQDLWDVSQVRKGRCWLFWGHLWQLFGIYFKRRPAGCFAYMTPGDDPQTPAEKSYRRNHYNSNLVSILQLEPRLAQAYLEVLDTKTRMQLSGLRGALTTWSTTTASTTVFQALSGIQLWETRLQPQEDPFSTRSATGEKKSPGDGHRVLVTHGGRHKTYSTTGPLLSTTSSKVRNTLRSLDQEAGTTPTCLKSEMEAWPLKKKRLTSRCGL